MGPEFNPSECAEGWQLSNPPILAMAPLMASLEHFDEVGMTALRRKSVALTGYLEMLVQEVLAKQVTIVTPADPEARGAALSLRVHVDRDRARAVFDWEAPQGTALIRIGAVLAIPMGGFIAFAVAVGGCDD